MKEKILKFFNLDKSDNIDNKNYILSFDGLRAIAVIFVTLYHLSPHIFSGGYLGVVIFLVMSGYLVTDNFIEEIDNTRYLDILKFWKKRIIKLYIPLIPMLSIVSLIIFLFYDEMLHGYFGNLLSSLFGVNNIYQIMNGLSYFESHGILNPFTHLWSLGLEMQFYLIWPIFITIMYNTFRIKRKNLSIIVLMLSLISALWMFNLYRPEIDVSRIYYGPDTRAFGFLIGSFFGILFPRKKVMEFEINGIKKYLLDVLTILLFSAIIYAFIFMDAKFDFVYKFGMYLFSIMVGIISVILLMKDNVVSKILSLLPFTLIGRRNYSLYLWQYPVMLFIGSKFTWSKISHTKLFIVELIFALIIAEFSYRIFEKKKSYLRYLNRKDEMYDRNLTLSVSLLALFVMLATSLTSFSKSYSDSHILKEKIAKIEENSKNNYSESVNINKKEKEKENKESDETKISDKKYTFIGDSVMLSAKEEIEEIFKDSIVDAKVSRQHWHLEGILKELKEKNQIYDNVVIHLGTNYKINKEKYVDVLKTLENKNIYLINCIVPESWEEQVNTTINEISKEMKNVKVIDWYSLAKEKKDWFYKDATHPNEIGAKEFVKLIEKSVKN